MIISGIEYCVSDDERNFVKLFNEKMKSIYIDYTSANISFNYKINPSFTFDVVNNFYITKERMLELNDGSDGATTIDLENIDKIIFNYGSSDVTLFFKDKSEMGFIISY